MFWLYERNHRLALNLGYKTTKKKRHWPIRVRDFRARVIIRPSLCLCSHRDGTRVWLFFGTLTEMPIHDVNVFHSKLTRYHSVLFMRSQTIAYDSSYRRSYWAVTNQEPVYLINSFVSIVIQKRNPRWRTVSGCGLLFLLMRSIVRPKPEARGPNPNRNHVVVTLTLTTWQRESKMVA